MFSKTLVIRRVGGLEDRRDDRQNRERVIRRVGGLEVYMGRFAIHLQVIRRVGGLEDGVCIVGGRLGVIRRVGGLEELPRSSFTPLGVIRRVGGLEVTVGAFLRLPLTCTRLYGERGVGGGHGPGAWWMGCSSDRGNTARAVTRARGKAGSRRRS